MKISYRILIINFAIVAVILGSSAIAFYSIMYNVLSSQQSKYLLNSANEFNYTFRSMVQDIGDEFRFEVNNNPGSLFSQASGSFKDIDFILETESSSSGVIINKVFKKSIELSSPIQTIRDFNRKYPYAIVFTTALPDSHFCYFGKIITSGTLNSISNKINSDIALVWNGMVTDVSNEAVNQKNLYLLNQAYKSLSQKNNFELLTKRTENSDILATIFKPSLDLPAGNRLSFLIFNSLTEATNLRSSLKYLLIVIGLAGIILSLILTLVFTDKIRKQISRLSSATKITSDGNFRNKIDVHGNDELTDLATAFNTMLDRLQINEKSKNEYSEFITLLNQNPTLSQVADAALNKIITTCGFIIGALYTVENDKITLASSYGVKKEIFYNSKHDFLDTVKNNRETIEISSSENLPVISTGIISLKIKNIILLPIVYNNSVVAILELGSFEKPSEETKDYLSKIMDQLAIGLTNATALAQLADLVTELKTLNDDYQKQNVQIRKQNETLVDLHKKLKEKAAELEIQKQKAEEATRVKSYFLASMSHELRTPMNSILGLTELILEDKTLTAKNRERIEVVLKSGKRLMNLINDILDLSKIEAGRMEIHNEEVLLEDLIKEIENSIIPLVNQKGLTFKVVRNLNTNIIISTDKGKVVQVLINLLGNAVKFTEKGFIEFHVSTVDEKYLCFNIIDSGIGISEEDQRIIFEEFRQVDATTTRKYTGTGLGLAISKRIADLMNGSIGVESKTGIGSKFTFSIPFRKIAVRELAFSSKINVKALAKNRKNPVLIIDDNPEVRYTIGQYLITNGYEVTYAESGDEGIEKAKKYQPFAITLDIMMPDKDGWTVLRELKESPLTKDIPVILISILADKNLGYGLGAFEYIVKPFAPGKLISVFKNLEGLAQKKIEKIVIVDDDEMEFEKFKDAFKDESIRIEYIKDSSLAFNKILEVQPDLIILDLIMKNTDGITLSHKLKSNKETNHIPIIISTSKDLTDKEKNSLNEIVEEITIKNKEHAENLRDILDAVKDRIKIQEKNTRQKEEDGISADGNQPGLLSLHQKDTDKKVYQGEVMVVDDDPDSLYTISEIVEACDCKTILARNGFECLKILENKTPGLILLDIMMPEMDGFQTISRIKMNDKWADIPVYAITAKAMLEDKEVILRNGFDDYIAKPVNSGVLAFKIERLFTKENIN